MPRRKDKTEQKKRRKNHEYVENNYKKGHHGRFIRLYCISDPHDCRTLGGRKNRLRPLGQFREVSDVCLEKLWNTREWHYQQFASGSPAPERRERATDQERHA